MPRKKALITIFIATCCISSLQLVKAQNADSSQFSNLEAGDAFSWTCVNSTVEDWKKGDNINITITALDSNNRKESVNISKLHQKDDKWSLEQENARYLMFNKSLNRLEGSIDFYLGYVFFIPSTLNLTMVGESIKLGGIYNYSVAEGQLLLFESDTNRSIELEFNPEGILKKSTHELDGETYLEWKLHEEKDIPPTTSDAIFPLWLMILLIIAITSSLILFSGFLYHRKIHDSSSGPVKHYTKYNNKLSSEEGKWLNVFSRQNDFFIGYEKILQKEGGLDKERYDLLRKNIKLNKRNGKTVLSDDEYYKFLEYSNENQQIARLLHLYRQKGILMDSDLKRLKDLID